MHIFPNSPDKKKDLYPAYMRRAAQAIPGTEVTEEQEPLDDAFEAIKDLPMFGHEDTAPVAEPVVDGVPGTEIPSEIPAEVPVSDEAPKGGVAEAVEKAQVAVEEAAVAIADAAETVKGDTDVAEVSVEVEEIDKKDEPKDDKPKDKPEDKDDKPEAKEEDKKDDNKPDFLKKEGDPEKEACAEDKKPAVKKDEECKDDKEVKASVIGGFTRMSDLSSQTKKEVYEYYRALGMPEEWCKALVKD